MASEDHRITPELAVVLGAMLSDPTVEWYGFDLCKRAGLKSGTVYPMLARLERWHWLESRWEDVDPVTEGRPRRRLYRLTGEGEIDGRRALDRLMSEVERARHAAGMRLRPGVAPS